jgi:hypothetical protein
MTTELPSVRSIFKSSNALIISLIVCLFVENYNYIAENESLIRQEALFPEILNFKLIFSFVVLVAISRPIFFFLKLLFFLIWEKIFDNYPDLYPEQLHESSTKFLLSALLIFHIFLVDESNEFYKYLGSERYSCFLIAISLFFFVLAFGTSIKESE